jgi:OmpR-family two-component system manganese-sensing response regulator
VIKKSADELEKKLAKILLVEDDAEYSGELKDCLELAQHRVEQAFDGDDGWQLLRDYKYDLIILDWEMPGITGVELCQKFRQLGGVTPILMLTGRGAVEDKESGLYTGADDYLTKPANAAELRARVVALTRRSPNLVMDNIQIADIVLDCNKREVTRQGKTVELLPREFALLEFLMRHPTRVFSSDELINQVWPSDAAVSGEVVRNTINRIRKKLEAPDFIKNVYSVGYGINDAN